MSWLGMSLTALLFSVVIFLAVPFFGKNYGIRPELFMLLYFLGVSVGGSSWMALNQGLDFSSTLPVLYILALGFFVGTPMNFLFFGAISGAPNPAMPIAIVNLAAPIIFLAAIFLAKGVPKYFDAPRADWVHFFGIVLCVIGGALIVLKR